MKKYIEKYMRIKERNLKYDFLPSVLEIIEKPENFVSNVTIVLIFSLLFITVIWAAVFKLDITVTAYGSLNVENNIVTINNEYAGTVSEICVAEGDYVEKGDVLLVLDASEENSQLEEAEEELQILNIQKEMYQKYQNEEDLSEFDTSIYGEQASIADAICREKELYILQKQQFDIVRESAEDKKLLNNQKDNFVAEHELALIQTLNTINELIDEKELELESLNQIIEGKKIKATTAGIISNWQINAEGYYLSTGQNITYIIPDEAENVFVAYVKTADIEAIEVGDEVNVKLAAFDNTEYERLTGKIQSIGSLTVALDGIGNVYPVEIVLYDVPQEMLHIGSEGTCYIIAGQRSVLDYFLEPLKKDLETALQER